ncbi:hypothetical protein HPP92_003255 [Vanilla planifolia]|uniref:Uncharacterized protein n=1 Tax=Vanilla planifolia TaxID=51239 RepID=A0A835VN94_VANPL|nr:hypothetical protein HPP92_003255 [Vanilla planifolia]
MVVRLTRTPQAGNKWLRAGGAFSAHLELRWRKRRLAKGRQARAEAGAEARGNRGVDVRSTTIFCKAKTTQHAKPSSAKNVKLLMPLLSDAE